MGIGSTTRADRSTSLLRSLANQVFSRAAGAPLSSGNRIRLLKDADANYSAWLEAMRSAKSSIHFESYIIHGDDIGYEFADVLAAKARQGVRVRVIYDWMGALGTGSRRCWRQLRAAGAQVRCFNRPRLDSPFGWLSRDHRKMIAVDGQIGFISGLCIGRQWVGYPERGIEPWRDTGVGVEGPAVADMERAFRNMWVLLGPGIEDDMGYVASASTGATGEVTLRIVATTPNTAEVYRLDQLIAALARRSMWLTDAYFIGTAAYVEALKAAAMDGVDVRLLVPRASDIPLMRSLSYAGLSGLLRAGVRVFEWNGPMLHAKTAVADGRWARVGSTNLNLASWFGNWELDVVVEDQHFARDMEDMYLEDLCHSTELVLGSRHKLRPSGGQPRRPYAIKTSSASAGKAGAGLLRIKNTVSAAITNRRTLDSGDATIMVCAAVLLLVVATVVILWPWIAAVPLVVLAVWIGVSLLIRTCRLRSKSEQPSSNHLE